MRESFGKRLKKIRKQKKDDQSTVITKIGRKSIFIMHYEKEDYTPNLVMFEWICDALGVSATELFGF